MDTELKIVEDDFTQASVIEVMKPQQIIEKKNTGRLILVQVPRNDDLLLNVALSTIRPYVTEIAGKTLNEYGYDDVHQSVWSGQSLLYMGYASDLKDGIDNLTALKHHLITPKVNFAGYVILTPNSKFIHIWQVYIMPEYQNTNILEIGFSMITNEIEKTGSPYITFSTYREGWKEFCNKHGFTETYTIFRKKLK